MALSQASLNAVLSWSQSRANTGFGNTTEGPDSLDFTLTGLNTSTFNQLFAQQYTINAGANVTLDLTSLQNFVYENYSLAHVLTLMVMPTGSKVTIQPGATNGLQWFFGGLTQSVTISDGGLFLLSEPVTGPGTVVSGTSKTIEFSNPGGTTLMLDVVALGGTT